MNKRSSSAGKERAPAVVEKSATLSSSPNNRSSLLSTSLSLLKNSPYSQTLDRQKPTTTQTTSSSTTLPAVNQPRRSKTPPTKSRPLSSSAGHEGSSTPPLGVRRSIGTSAVLPPAPLSHRGVTTLPPTGTTPPNGNGLGNTLLKSKTKTRERERERDKEGGKERDSYKDDRLATDRTLDDGRKGLQVIKPKEQLNLTEEQLNEELNIVLTANDPQLPSGLVIFSLMDDAYKPSTNVDQVTDIFDLEGYYLHLETEEAKKQVAFNMEEKRKQTMRTSSFNEAAQLYGTGEYDNEADKVLRNPFNFSDRAVQTNSRPARDRSTMTEPAARGTFGATVTQWAIYDAYDEERTSQGGGASGAAPPIASASGTTGGAVSAKPADASKRAVFEPKNFIPVEYTDTKAKSQGSGGATTSSTTTIQESPSFMSKLHIMERMVIQNATMGITMDFKYWDDPADQYQDEGTLLPLWKFCPSVAHGKTVTAICWNSRYHDLFAIGHGSYDFVKMTSALLPTSEISLSKQHPDHQLPFSAGVICCYSLKNIANPEYVFVSESGIMCLDFHPQHPSLLAVGMYDGRVAVYSLTQPASHNPLFISSVRQKKHTEPVWVVRWQEDDLSKNLNFYSLSSDGRLTSWTLVKNEMLHNDILEMKITRKPSHAQSNGTSNGSSSSDPLPDDADNDTSLYGLAGGCCMDFLHGDHLFIVGTEEGALHKCSKAYSGRYLASYEGHNMAILSVEWNGFHPRVFLTCGADWSVKMWDHTRTDPIFTLDFKIPVCDAKWAPFSSTVFAVATADGKISVYDLSRNKRDPLCCQLVTKSVPTHIAFNPIQPVILVTDSIGRVHSLKLSPNLRHAPVESEDPAIARAKSSTSSNDLFRVVSSNKQLSSIVNAGKEVSEESKETIEKNNLAQEEIKKLEHALMTDLKKDKKP